MHCSTYIVKNIAFNLIILQTPVMGALKRYEFIESKLNAGIFTERYYHFQPNQSNSIGRLVLKKPTSLK